MPSIAICGAGPAGLTLARLLQRAELPSLQVIIFEKDESPTARFYQGGSLDLHRETGLAAIKEAGLWEEFQRHARYEGEELKFGDFNGTIYAHITEAPQINGFDDRPEIDREKLKQILLESVRADSIRWGKKLSRADARSGELLFTDGSQAGPFDLVVGAEGAWSKVRSILSAESPTYSGICGLQGHIDQVSAGAEWDTISKLAGQGSYFLYAGGRGIGTQRVGDGSINMSTWLQKEATWSSDLIERAGGDDQKIINSILRELSDLDPTIIPFVKRAHGFRSWPLYELPVGHRWEHRTGWTLVGDSAHLMTPFAGEGVNAAMRDALDLAKAIVKARTLPAGGGGDGGGVGNKFLDDAVIEYETGLFPRAKQVQEATARNKNGMFAVDAPIGFLATMVGVAAKEVGYNLDHGWLYWLPVRRVTYAWFWSIWLFGIVRRKTRSTIFGA